MASETERVLHCMLAMQRHSWEQGVCAQALYEAGKDELWIPMAYDAVKRQSPDGRLAMAGSMYFRKVTKACQRQEIQVCIKRQASTSLL